MKYLYIQGPGQWLFLCQLCSLQAEIFVNDASASSEIFTEYVNVFSVRLHNGNGFVTDGFFDFVLAPQLFIPLSQPIFGFIFSSRHFANSFSCSMLSSLPYFTATVGAIFQAFSYQRLALSRR